MQEKPSQGEYNTVYTIHLHLREILLGKHSKILPVVFVW